MEVLDFPGPKRRSRTAPWLGKEGGRPSWYVYWWDGVRVRRRSAGTAERVEAEVFLADFTAELRGGRRPSKEAEGWEAIADRMVERQRRSAKARNIPFALTARYVLALLQRANFRCSVSGIGFSDERGEFHKNPWAPSIDRIDNRGIYEPGNVQIVCLAVSLAMNEWGYDVLLRLAHGVVNSSFSTAESQ